MKWNLSYREGGIMNTKACVVVMHKISTSKLIYYIRLCNRNGWYVEYFFKSKAYKLGK